MICSVCSIGLHYLILKFLSVNLFLWGHELANSFLLFSVHKSLLQIIKKFSLRHRLHFLLILSYGLQVASTFHCTRNGFLASFRVHIYFDSSVSFLLFACRNEVMWFLYLSLKFVASPTYDSFVTSVVTDAWYTTFAWNELASENHVSCTSILPQQRLEVHHSQWDYPAPGHQPKYFYASAGHHGFEIRVFLLLGELPTKASKLHLPGTNWCSGASNSPFTPSPVGSKRLCHEKARNWVSVVRGSLRRIPYGTFLKTVKRSALTAIPAVTTFGNTRAQTIGVYTYIYTC